MTTYRISAPTTGWTRDPQPHDTNLLNVAAPRTVVYHPLSHNFQLAVSLVERRDGIQVEDAWIEEWQDDPADAARGCWVEREPVLLGDIELA
jgi:hypothetical protein